MKIVTTIVLFIVLVPFPAVAAGNYLPRSVQALNIPAQVALDMTKADLNKVKGHLVISGRFVSLEMPGGGQMALVLDPSEKRVQKITALLSKGKWLELRDQLKKKYSEKANYEREKLPRFESHQWHDDRTKLALIWNTAGYRVELTNLGK